MPNQRQSIHAFCLSLIHIYNTLPVTSAAVAVEVGNIAVLLGTI